MLTLRPSKERGYFDHGWLKTHHSFSFASYIDPNHVGFRSLRVINEDYVAADSGFPTHPHRDMEILTYVVSGTLTHADSMGNERELKAGEVQVMTAGTGLTHSEYNASTEEDVHMLQIWIKPRAHGLTPQYDQRAFSDADKREGWVTLASADTETLTIQQDATVLATIIPANSVRTYNLSAERHAWVQVVRGSIEVNGTSLNAGDGAALSDVSEVALTSGAQDTELLLFDLS